MTVSNTVVPFRRVASAGPLEAPEPVRIQANADVYGDDASFYVGSLLALFRITAVDLARAAPERLPALAEYIEQLIAESRR